MSVGMAVRKTESSLRSFHSSWQEADGKPSYTCGSGGSEVVDETAREGMGKEVQRQSSGHSITEKFCRGGTPKGPREGVAREAGGRSGVWGIRGVKWR